ncbi:MAG: histidine kinase dimerization/phospho-acceptor domain-containing protein [Rhodomicrobium sp.]
MSHELRTTMHAISNYSSMILRSLGDDQPTTKKYVENIKKSSERMVSLLNNLLDLSKMGSRKNVYKLQLDNFGKAVEQSVIELLPLLQAKMQTVETNIAEDIISVRFDRPSMVQVLVKLISNAAKFSNNTTELQIDVFNSNLPNGGQALMCRVAGQGPGPPDGGIERCVR